MAAATASTSGGSIWTGVADRSITSDVSLDRIGALSKACRCCAAAIANEADTNARGRRSQCWPAAPTVPVTASGLLFDFSAALAARGILVAGPATAAYRADQLAAFDEWKSAGACDQRGIECRHVGMAGLVGIIKQT